MICAFDLGMKLLLLRGGMFALPPLVECPDCRVQLVRIRSNQRATYGKTFVKCPNNIKVSQFVFNLEFLRCFSWGTLFHAARVLWDTG